MSPRNVHLTDGAARAGASAASGGRVRRGGVGRPVLIAAAAVALASIFVLLAAPDRVGVPRAAARTTGVTAARAAGMARLSLMTQFDSRRLRLAQAQVAIKSPASLVSAPRSFFGLSTEYWTLPLYGRRLSLFDRVLSLLHVRGDGPLVLRIGGDSADHAFWDPTLRRVPPWAFRLTPAWLRQTSRIVHRVGVRLMLDLNLVTGSALNAARWARAAETGLPPASIVGFEIGNEPDIYSRPYWQTVTSRQMLPASVLPKAISASSYTQAFQSYADTLSAVAASIPLAGPALAEPALNLPWISSLLAVPHPGLGIVTAHRYPYSACVDRRSASFPTIARLLSEHASVGIARSVNPAVGVAHRAGLQFRLTELNSVTCGGRTGVSDTFATALWAPDALFELLRAGVDGVNLHVRAHAINAPFTLTRDGLSAHPLLYGLMLFARTLGPDARLVPVRLHAEASLHLKAWAVRVRGDDLHVLLINKSNLPIKVGLRLPATGPATVQRLLAPSARSTSGVTLDGQQLARDGRWQGQPANQTITSSHQRYELTIPPLSAALVRVHLRPVQITLNAVPGHP